MRSCIILGTGRSGTSMVTGALASAGYFMGTDLHPARASNPKGFFESNAINELNEQLLAPVIPNEQGLGEGQRWLGFPASGQEVKAPAELAQRMQSALGEGPYCHKDPRFCFTLPAWRGLLGDARLVCVFRHPALTAQSMLEECKRASYLTNLELDSEHIFQLWIAAHREILEKQMSQGEWLFLHYDQVLSESGLERLGSFLDVAVDADFPDSKLRRTQIELEAPPEALEIYERLCELAQHRDQQQATDRAEQEPQVSFLAIISDGDEGACAEMVEDARAQRGATTEIVFIDQTKAGALEVEGARVVRCDSHSRGTAWRAGVAETRAALVAWLRPGCRLLPSHLAYALEALDAEDQPNIVLCDYYLHDDQGQFNGRAHPGEMGEVPGPYWDSGAVMRREVLEEISELAFHPVELKLWQEQRTAGKAAYVTEPGYSVSRDSYEAGWETSSRDGTLLACAKQRSKGDRPEMTVSIVSYNRKDILIEGIESFCRQHLPYGTLEIVVVNDGSTDGTREMLDGLEYPVPVKIIHQENGGIATARNTGLEVIDSRYVLFVNDDTIAFPDLVEQHLRTHRNFPKGTKASVLGHFEQPKEALSNAMVRHIEFSNDVFCYSRMKPLDFNHAQHFYTCNVSLELDVVRSIGGFDEAFRTYGCEDTDFSLRLSELGYSVYYQPAARALHRHIMDFAYLKRRQFIVGRAYVHLFRKHPAMLEDWGIQNMTVEDCRRHAAKAEECVKELEAACSELGYFDVGALEAVGGPTASIAKDVMARLPELLKPLNAMWWSHGYQQGFKEHRLSGFHEIKRTPQDPKPLETEASRRLFAWPSWDDAASMDRLMATIEPIAHDGFAALILYLDPKQDMDKQQAIEALQAAHERCFGEGVETALEVLIDSTPKDRWHLFRFGRTVNAALPTGREPEGFLEDIVAEKLRSCEEVARWRRRFEGPEVRATLTPQLKPATAEHPELSVVIPTHNRSRELLQLIEKLSQQDLEAQRFEVIVVDDGSKQPVSQVLAQVETPFRLEVITQTSAGPGAARNRGVAQARGDLIVFFNDDAVPASDNLRRHLEVHASRSEQHALIGTFTQLPELVVDSFTRHVETSRTLFAQPLMTSGVLYGGLSFCTGNLSIARRLLDEVGGFDESFVFAGGEDSELGLRLERELGVRVLFDESVRCEHDHVLDIKHYLRRMQVIGWSASKIDAKHGDTGLLPDAPSAPEGWLAMQQKIDEETEVALGMLAQIEAICQHERQGGKSDVSMENFRKACDGLSGYGFRRGMLAAHAGELPDLAEPAAASA